MSRSRKKHPFCGMTTATTEKQDKRLANRSLRRRTRVLLSRDVETDVLPELRDVSNHAAMSKDGKTRFDPEQDPKEMRK